MKKYEVRMSRYNVTAKIKEVEVERETSASVWIGGRRHAKITEYGCYFDSWDAAKAVLLKGQSDVVDLLLSRLNYATERLEAVKALVCD